MSSLRIIGQTISRNLALWFTSVVLLTTMYYVALMIALIVRFQRLPNYANLYDWIFSIQHIWQSTPSSIDALTIMKDEWLLEVGFMNYDFGFGISEWSLFIAPFKVLGIMVLSKIC